MFSCCHVVSDVPSIWQVESIVLSIISMLSSPNDESPANVEAAVHFLFPLFLIQSVKTNTYSWVDIDLHVGMRDFRRISNQKSDHK